MANLEENGYVLARQVLQMKPLKVVFSDRLEGLLEQAKKIQMAFRVQVKDLISSLRVPLFLSTASLLQASQITVKNPGCKSVGP